MPEQGRQTDRSRSRHQVGEYRPAMVSGGNREGATTHKPVTLVVETTAIPSHFPAQTRDRISALGPRRSETAIGAHPCSRGFAREQRTSRPRPPRPARESRGSDPAPRPGAPGRVVRPGGGERSAAKALARTNRARPVENARSLLGTQVSVAGTRLLLHREGIASGNGSVLPSRENAERAMLFRRS